MQQHQIRCRSDQTNGQEIHSNLQITETASTVTFQCSRPMEHRVYFIQTNYVKRDIGARTFILIDRRNSKQKSKSARHRRSIENSHNHVLPHTLYNSDQLIWQTFEIALYSSYNTDLNSSRQTKLLRIILERYCIVFLLHILSCRIFPYIFSRKILFRRLC